MPASTILQLRRGTAALWTSANPILAQGEEGYETDTGKMKIGDGITAWASLPYGGPTGPASTQVLESYGDGSDGNVTISSGVTVLSRDMFYNNLTINGTGQINTSGYKIFVAGTLDISAAGVAAIFNNGSSGSNAATQTGGALGVAAPGSTVAASAAATAGANSIVGGGNQATAASAGWNGGASNASGAGGNGGPNAGPTSGGASRAGTATTNTLPIRRYETDLFRGAALIIPGGGGPGGGGGSGDGTTVGNGCGGGGGGGGGGVVAIWANAINRGASTAASCIQAMGGNGGNGRNAQGTYTFTISAGSTASVGATYTNNGQTFIVTTALIASATSIVTQVTTSGVPTNTGTLTLASGTGSATIAFTAVSVTDSVGTTNAQTGVGGGGGGSGGGGGWILIQYNNLTGSTATNCLDASGGNGGIGGNGANTYVFTITAGQTATAGATFTNNGQTFTAITNLTGAQTVLNTIGTGAPSASGTLTKQNGTSSGNITFSSSTAGTTGTGANAGSGGNGGRIALLQVTTSTGSESFTGTGTTGPSNSGIFGGNFGAGGVNRVSL